MAGRPEEYLPDRSPNPTPALTQYMFRLVISKVKQYSSFSKSRISIPPIIPCRLVRSDIFDIPKIVVQMHIHKTTATQAIVLPIRQSSPNTSIRHKIPSTSTIQWATTGRPIRKSRQVSMSLTVKLKGGMFTQCVENMKHVKDR